MGIREAEIKDKAKIQYLYELLCAGEGNQLMRHVEVV
jgi:hypothetical protein